MVLQQPAEIKARAPQDLTERIGVITTTDHGQTLRALHHHRLLPAPAHHRPRRSAGAHGVRPARPHRTGQRHAVNEAEQSARLRFWRHNRGRDYTARPLLVTLRGQRSCELVLSGQSGDCPGQDSRARLRGAGLEQRQDHGVPAGLAEPLEGRLRAGVGGQRGGEIGRDRGGALRFVCRLPAPRPWPRWPSTMSSRAGGASTAAGTTRRRRPCADRRSSRSTAPRRVPRPA